MKLYRLNDQTIEITGLMNLADDTPVNDAVITATLFDKDGGTVPGVVDIPGEYQAGTDGDYRFPIEGVGFDPPNGVLYRTLIQGEADGKAFSVSLRTTVAIRRTGTD